MKVSYLILFLLLISCKNVQGIESAIQKINKCYEGTNQINVDTKVTYEENNRILTFYIGQDNKKSFQKWEIPMKKIESKNIFFENEEFHYVKIKTTKDLDIKYYENDILNDSLSQFVYPIHDYCFKSNEVKGLIINLQKETNAK
ncbi:hypothetical protein [Chryseobacterium sp. NKUCC03_KSP]|uniref:hypothetical protein n=1 Tax=Chryseobacterium sp. NKUCC03_KSP TaxID=2842125 RepID=UPI001C5B3509|nr:hypothetical protein [Chryseobacterium sp. NKUCC03_KSP]MBW3522855.1 hypothetical protein [Chryseobacterium sp. NKUCC03_KSP]